jgi:protein-S-isoprenylcysteine O-methyltransferase Ste14
LVFARRLWVGLSVVVLAAFFVRPRPAFGGWRDALNTAQALAFILVGLGIRAWASGCAGEHTRTATIGAPQLVTGGPYAYVRNPIYLASIVLGYGMLVLVGDPWLLAFYIGVFVFLYGAIVPAEERFLRAKFGALYERYCAHVPRLWPRATPWPDAQRVRFQPRAILGEARLALVLAGIYALLRFGAWLRT